MHWPVKTWLWKLKGSADCFLQGKADKKNISLGIGAEQHNRSTRGIPATTQHDYNSADEPRVPLIEIPERRRNLDNFE